MPGTRVVLIATPPRKSNGKKSSPPDAMFSAYTVGNITRYKWIVSHCGKCFFFFFFFCVLKHKGSGLVVRGNGLRRSDMVGNLLK